MLPKKYRLIRREDFKNTFTKGVFIGIPEGIAVKVLRNESDQSRLGFPIGKSYSKKAVERNRAKRILRNGSFPLLKDLKRGFDIIVLMKPGKKDTDFKNVSEQLKKVFTKANLLN